MKTKKRSFNIIDAVMIVAVAALTAALVYGIVSGLGVGNDYVRIKYVLEVGEIRSEFCQKAAEGDAVRSADGGEQIGKVSAVSSVPAQYTGTDSSGAPVLSDIDGYSTLYVTVEARAKQVSTGYTVGGTLINTGNSLDVRLPSLCFEAKCISVEVIKD